MLRLYYVRTGSVDATQIATSYKQAAIKTLRKFENYGKFIVVGISDLDDESSCNSQMFFSTETLLKEPCTDSNMKLIY